MTFQRRPISRTHDAPRKHIRGSFSSHILPFLVGVFFLLCLGFGMWIMSVGSLVISSGTYTLERGITLSTIPLKFDLDISPIRYKLYLRFFAPKVETLKAGSYKITTDTTLEEVLEKELKNPTYSDLTITILPGWNMYDIDAYLSDKNIVPTGAFLLAARDHFGSFREKYPFLENRISMEGFLYPDTYRIRPTADSYMIIDKFLSEWQKKIGETYANLGKDAYESLILASIVEREERKLSEKTIVADILAKRVREGMPMGADATVCYAYAKTQKQCTPSFIASVITQKDPYNTRNKQGYPPTPISSISAETWNAVLSKQPSPYYYYLHDNDGIIHYARTNDEHNQNKQKYLY